jgi:hypothetical protein
LPNDHRTNDTLVQQIPRPKHSQGCHSLVTMLEFEKCGWQ